jgi:nucleoside-diphosphate-sugar epimerase
VARALIVGCGCRGRELGRELAAEGWAVRGTTRSEDRTAEIVAAGLEAAVADPDRPGTILDLVGDVAVVVWLLAGARGEPEAVAAIHTARLEGLLQRLVDSPVRAFVYEGRGPVARANLERGREIVERASRTWRMPVAILDQDPGAAGWTESAAARIRAALGGSR